MITPVPDPGPRPGTRLHREYPDPPVSPREPDVGEQSATWCVSHDDGSATTLESSGHPLADPVLHTLLHVVFVESPLLPETPPEREESLLHISWQTNGVSVGSAELFADGRLILDDGTGPHVDRQLNADQLQVARAALAAVQGLRPAREGK